MPNLIELRGVERRFSTKQGDLLVLGPLDLQIAAGRFVVLSGPSGSGKTTLLNLIAGLDQPSAGEVRLFGHALQKLSALERARLRSQLGLIFQSFALLPTASAYENLEIALRLSQRHARSDWDTRIRACLASVGLGEWAEHRPSELSGGQQQRVAIARALVHSPRLILADEATGDLDHQTARHMLELLRTLVDKASLSVVLVTHDPQALQYANEHYQLYDGRCSKIIA